MTKQQREQSLINARRACEWLDFYVARPQITDDRIQISVGPLAQANIWALLDEFQRLDAKEQKQIRAGKRYGKLGAEHGHKGGRPKKTTTEEK